jgi:hypothetical protein
VTSALVVVYVAAASVVLLAWLTRRPYTADVALLALAAVAVSAGLVLALQRLLLVL